MSIGYGDEESQTSDGRSSDIAAELKRKGYVPCETDYIAVSWHDHKAIDRAYRNFWEKRNLPVPNDYFNRKKKTNEDKA